LVDYLPTAPLIAASADAISYAMRCVDETPKNDQPFLMISRDTLLRIVNDSSTESSADDRSVRRQVIERLGVPAARVHVAGSGAPAWRTLGRGPHLPPDGAILCFGTLEPRKNIGALLDAYARLLGRRRPVPPLVLAGRAARGSEGWLARLAQPPLAGHVTHLGYVADRERTYASARLLVVPSLDEGFSLPALEAMAAGIPVVATNRGALPEVVGDAAALVDPTDVEALAAAIERALDDGAWAERAARAGLARATRFTWAASAARLHDAYRDAVARRRRRAPVAGVA
jgi:alpha-1,3-rhamnosyl/mannosyltransferase